MDEETEEMQDIGIDDNRIKANLNACRNYFEKRRTQVSDAITETVVDTFKICNECEEISENEAELILTILTQDAKSYVYDYMRANSMELMFGQKEINLHKIKASVYLRFVRILAGTDVSVPWDEFDKLILKEVE